MELLLKNGLQKKQFQENDQIIWHIAVYIKIKKVRLFGMFFFLFHIVKASISAVWLMLNQYNEKN